MMQPTPGATRQ